MTRFAHCCGRYVGTDRERPSAHAYEQLELWHEEHPIPCGCDAEYLERYKSRAIKAVGQACGIGPLALLLPWLSWAALIVNIVEAFLSWTGDDE